MPVQTSMPNDMRRFDFRTRAVCQHWKDVIDSTPALWKCLYFQHDDHVDHHQLSVILQRSKNIPLELALAFDSPSQHVYTLGTMSQTRALILDMQRTFSVFSIGFEDMTQTAVNELLMERDYATVYYTDRLKSMQQLLNQPAPLLEEFVAGHMKEFPEDIFTRTKHPCLRSITLDTCRVSHLNLETVDITTLRSISILYDVEGVLMMLKTLPQLRRFEWDTFSTGVLNSGHAFEPKSVQLPELEQLHLVLPMSVITHVISALNFPVSTELILEGTSWTVALARFGPALLPHFQALFSEFATGYTTMTIGPYKQYEVDKEGFDPVDRGGFDVVMEHASASLPPFKYGLTWDDFKPQQEHTDLLLEILRLPGMSFNVSRLYVKHDSFMCGGPRSWFMLLRALPALVTVHVDGGPVAQAFSEALHDIAQYQPGVASTLEAITMSRADTAAASGLIRALDTRVHAGLKKLALSLHRCKISELVEDELVYHDGVSRG